MAGSYIGLAAYPANLPSGRSRVEIALTEPVRLMLDGCKRWSSRSSREGAPAPDTATLQSTAAGGAQRGRRANMAAEAKMQ
jgi:hypothetical protein